MIIRSQWQKKKMFSSGKYKLKSRNTFSTTEFCSPMCLVGEQPLSTWEHRHAKSGARVLQQQ